MRRPQDDAAAPDLRALLRARYGDAVAPLQGAARNASDAAGAPDLVVDVLLQHRSVRDYLPRPLDSEVLPLMVAAAQSASSSSNLQTWSVLAVQDAARKDRLARLAGNQRHIRECPLFLVWLADLARLDAVGARRALARGGLDTLELLMVGVIDAALAAQNAAVAAEAQGLGVVYIGGMRNHPEAVADELGLPPRTFAVFGMCVGHPDPARPADVKPRLPQAAVLHHERYDAAANQQPVDDYVAVMDAFYAAQQMQTAGDWATHSLNRVRSPEALNGRHRLMEALRNRGFPAR